MALASRLAFPAAPLIAAADKGHYDCVRLLLDRGADPNQGGKSGETALMGACGGNFSSRHFIACTRLLLCAGADPNAARTDNGSTALMAAALLDDHFDNGGNNGQLEFAMLSTFGGDPARPMKHVRALPFERIS